MHVLLWRCVTLCVLCAAMACTHVDQRRAPTASALTVAAATDLRFDTTDVVAEADAVLALAPDPITLHPAANSTGGPHDYYSEGRYWWPDPANPDGPYVRRDGESNPGMFDAHHDGLAEMAEVTSTLAVAYLHTRDAKYAEAARRHLRAWFVDEATGMNPNLEYGQAIKGITTGRGIGIIDTRPLIYVAQSVDHLAAAGALPEAEERALRQWFGEYNTWLVMSEKGQDERDNGNNHSSWWGAQVAAFAKTAGQPAFLDTARAQFRRQLTQQMNAAGDFPEELARTKPGDYSRYNLDALAVLAELASAPGNNLWAFETPNGGLRKGIDRLAAYYRAPKTWTYGTDIEPELQPEPTAFLYLGARHYGDAALARLYRRFVGQPYYTSQSQLALLTWPNATSK